MARILGIDTSLRSTGIAVVEAKGNELSAVDYGKIKVSASKPLSECLVALSKGLDDIIKKTRPDAVAIEGAFYSKNAKTAMTLGQVRGVAIAVCAAKNLPVYEYAPRRIKQAVTGNGAADKSQVRKMVMTLLALKEEPQEDAGDALAIAICHLHNMTGHAALAPEAI